MSDEYFVENGVVKTTTSEGSEARIVTSEEFWESRESDQESHGLFLNGYGQIRLNVLVQNELVCLRGTVSYSVLEVALPLDYIFPSDHVVIGNEWIPFREEDLIELQNQLLDAELELNQLMSLKDYSNVLYLQNQNQVRVNIEDSVIDYFSAQPAPNMLNDLNFEPFEYQKSGISWLLRMTQMGLGCILADEMGLGKTAQIIGLIDLTLRQNTNSKILVVVPTSLVLNWCNELVKFSGFSEKTIVHSGNTRLSRLQDLDSASIILTTYEVMIRDTHILGSFHFDLFVADEAHALRNVDSLRRKAVSGIRAKTKVLITGTPIQNYLLDLWSLMDLVEPGLLGKIEYFEDLTKSSPNEAAALGVQASPFILRRLGSDVQLQMPKSFFSLVQLPFSPEDQGIYEAMKAGNHGLTYGKKGMAAFPALRIFAAHTGTIDNDPARGTKAEYLKTELQKIFEVGEKALIFVDEFDAPVDLYLELVSSIKPGCFVKSIDGRTDQKLRFPIVETFSKFDGFAALIIKPSVGGEGLNITSANHVFHMNPAWNPAKVDQATFRVLRPGQRRTTYVHQIFYSGSIEESMMNLLSHKKEISLSALEQAEAEGANKTI